MQPIAQRQSPRKPKSCKNFTKKSTVFSRIRGKTVFRVRWKPARRRWIFWRAANTGRRSCKRNSSTKASIVTLRARPSRYLQTTDCSRTNASPTVSRNHGSIRAKGPVRIRLDLNQRGVADAVIDAALQASGADWRQLAKEVKAKKFGLDRPVDFKAKAKQMQFLSYRGFEPDQIQAAVGD